MYYQNYEDYMRQVLGYPINDSNIYENYNYMNQINYEDTYPFRDENYISNMSEDEVRECYPEIYNLVYPMVCKVCEANTQPITKELIEKMTDEVYFAIEDSSTVVNIRVDTPKVEDKNNLSVSQQRKDRIQGREDSRIHRRDTSITSSQEKRDISPKVKESRQFNSGLRDLIKILLLFRLFGNRPGKPRPPRPPFPGGPGKPPFPGGRPPIGPGRPPIQPRDYSNLF